MAHGTIGVYLPFGPGIGLGHLVRCSALASRLKALGWQTILITDGNSPLPDFCREVFGLRRDISDIANDTSIAADWLVIDHYTPDVARIKKITSATVKWFVICDLADQDVSDADLVLNQSLDARLPPTARDDQKHLLGPAFALLRPAFAVARPRSRPPSERKALERVLIAPGATDPQSVTDRLIPVLLDASLSVDVVLSSVAPNIQAVSKLCASNPDRVRLLVDADDISVAKAMTEADLVIGNGGGGSWERCTLGAPSIVLEMADNQRDNIAALKAAGSICFAGAGAADDMPARVINIIDELRSNPEKLAEMSANAFQVCDGLGVDRVSAILDQQAKCWSEVVTLRTATSDDCEMVYRWQVQPETRRFARNTAVPNWQEHKDWFAAKIADHRALFTIVERDGAPAGSVRLDYCGERMGAPMYEVSIFLDPQWYGRGVASKALGAAAQLMPFSYLKAVVRPENKASLRLFQRAGYEGEEDVFYLPPRR